MMHTEKIKYCGIGMEVSGDYLRYIPGTMYTKNGDPGDPPEGGYIEGPSVLVGGVDITELISDYHFVRITEKAYEQWSEAKDEY